MFIVAEIFPQHSGDLDLAETLILQSKMGGASAVKLQLYKGNQFSKDGLDRNYIELDFEGLKRLMDYGAKVGISVFSTAFDIERLDWLVELNSPYFKIAARMHSEMPELVEKILKLERTTFVSIADDSLLNRYKKLDHTICLKCVSQYPTLLEDWDFEPIREYQYDGISDHSSGIAAPLKACTLGMNYLEKHFTLSRNLQKNTEKAHTGSMDFEELLRLKRLTLEMELIGNKPKKI
jgi:sialic acid synthase SpsE